MDSNKTISKGDGRREEEGISVAPVSGFNAQRGEDLGKRDDPGTDESPGVTRNADDDVRPAGASLLKNDRDFTDPKLQEQILAKVREIEGSIHRMGDHLKTDHRISDAVRRLKNRFWGQKKSTPVDASDDFII